MFKILLVCTANICRSPMAQVVLGKKVQEAGLADKVTVESAGT
jgi:protein-tyrosine phosphatase